MRPDTKLIENIQTLKGIKPRQDWVVSVKNQILEREITPVQEGFLTGWRWPHLVLQYRMAVATLVVVGLLMGTFGFAQKAMPGDFLYALKKAAEKTKLSFVPEKERPMIHLEYANENLQNIVKIVENKRKEKLTPIIEEYQNSVNEAARSLSQTKQPDVRKIVEKTKELEESKQKIESLGVIVGETEEWNNALAQMTEQQIKDLESATLSEEQKEQLEEAKTDYESGDYSQSLEKILNLSNTNLQEK